MLTSSKEDVDGDSKEFQLPGDGDQAQECQAFHFDPCAAEFHPGSWNIRAQPKHIQDLYTQWSCRAFPWEKPLPLM